MEHIIMIWSNSRIFHNYREIYHGSDWMSDDRFQTPMISCHAGHVFVGDFVRCHTQGGNLAVAKVMQYFMTVKLQECGNLYV